MDNVTAERIAENDAVFRDANEAIRQSAERYGITDQVPFVCECADPECTIVIRLSLDEYEEVRRHPTAFLNATGHVVGAGASGRVVKRCGGYDVVRRTPGVGGRP